MHAAEVEQEATLPYDPLVHAVQADVPVTSALKAPATQAVHTRDVVAERTLEYAPAVQPVHTPEALAADTLPYEPLQHAVQTDVPLARALYAPAAQAVHTTDVLAFATLL